MTVWSPGDIALCIYSGPWFRVGAKSPHQLKTPVKGRVYTVVHVGVYDDNRGNLAQYLGLEEFLPLCFNAACFRKIAGNVELLSKRERDWVLRDEPEKEDA